MKRMLMMVAAVLAGAGSVSLSARDPIQTLTGAVMCRSEHRSTYSAVCPAEAAHYVFVSGSSVFDIKHQTFSGLRPLVGQSLRVIGEVRGRSLDILQAMEWPRADCPDDVP